jgi:uncharacterized protein (TIGR03084 family)
VRAVSVIDALAAQHSELEGMVGDLPDSGWQRDTRCPGWTVADVVLHLAQTEEMVQASVGGVAGALGWDAAGGETVDERAEQAVRAERTAPKEVFERWRSARVAAVAALRGADPGQPLRWVAGVMKPASLATTRLAEHWTHGLDITGPLGIEFPDTGRLRHVAWLAHRTLPYAFQLAGLPPVAVRCELTAPEGPWEFGPADAESMITGPGGDFCRVAAQRMDAADSALKATGPHGATALRLLRTYAR